MNQPSIGTATQRASAPVVAAASDAPMAIQPTIKPPKALAVVAWNSALFLNQVFTGCLLGGGAVSRDSGALVRGGSGICAPGIVKRYAAAGSRPSRTH